MSSISDRITKGQYEQLKAENRRLQQALEWERTKLEASERELRRLLNWTEKIVEPLAGRLADDVGAIKALMERTSSKIMADLQTLADLVTQARGDAATEAQEVKSKLDEQTALIQQLQQSQNDPAKVQAIADELAGLQTDIRSIFTGETPQPEPEPTPEPVPEPQPGRRR